MSVINAYNIYAIFRRIKLLNKKCLFLRIIGLGRPHQIGALLDGLVIIPERGTHYLITPKWAMTLEEY